MIEIKRCGIADMRVSFGTWNISYATFSIEFQIMG